MSQRNLLRQGAKIIRREESSDWLEGSVYLEKAKTRLDEAEHEAAKIKEQAWQQGYRDGQLAGMREVQLLIAGTQAAIKTFHCNLEREVAGLALAISRKIVDSMDLSDAIANEAAEATALFKADANLTLFVPPALYESIKAKLACLLSAPDAKIPQVDVQPDAGLGGSRAFLTAETGSIDLGIPAQFEAIENSLRAGIAEGSQ